eukprot:scaffold7595_cov107-Isochrysis_galbana.AAC.1
MDEEAPAKVWVNTRSLVNGARAASRTCIFLGGWRDVEVESTRYYCGRCRWGWGRTSSSSQAAAS